MITVGDVQFEPNTSKIFALTNSIFAVTSGESSVNAEIINATYAEVNKRLAAAPVPGIWLPVEEAARIVADQVHAYTMRLGDMEVLRPLGLTRQSFLQQAKTHWFQETFDKLFTMDSGSDIIVAGVDISGPHIWKIDGKGKPWLHDPAAFAAVGIGQRHAESQFQVGFHSRWMPFSQALFLTYKAKRRSEVAPGVGRIFTDIVVIPKPGSLTWLQLDDIKFLEELYRSLREKEWEVEKQQAEEITQKFQQLQKTAADAAAAANTREQQPSERPPDVIDVTPNKPDGASA